MVQRGLGNVDEVVAMTVSEIHSFGVRVGMEVSKKQDFEIIEDQNGVYFDYCFKCSFLR